MLLTEKACLNIEINNLKIDFKFDFRVIENLYYGLAEEFICKKLKIKNVTPLQLLEEIVEYNEGYLILLLHSSSNGFYDIDTIINEVNKVSNIDKENIYSIIKNIIIQSLIYIEPKEDDYKKSTSSKKENKGEKNYKEVFENWFNYYYTMAIDKLKMTLDHFYNSTPSQIKERVYRINVDKKNTYILAYCEVMKAKANNERNEPEVEDISNPWEFINRI